MKFGIHAGLWMAKWTDEITPILKIVSDLGFDGVEISLLGMSTEKAKTLNAEIKNYGLEVMCSDGLSIEADITSDNLETREKGEQHLRWAIATSSIIGAKSLAGVIYAPWGVFDPENKGFRAAKSAETFLKLDGFLKSHDIKLGIEAINRFETDLVNTSAEAVSMAKASRSTNVGILLDTFHLNIEEKDIKSALITAGNHLIHFHVSDNDRGVPGSGHIPWKEVSSGLSEIGYNGWIVSEMFVMAGNPSSRDLNIWRNIETDPTLAAKKALTFMKETFK